MVFNPVNESILVFTQSGLRCYQDDGTSASLLWSQSYAYPWYSSTAVAENGDVYVIDGGGTLRRLNMNTGATINSSAGYGGGYGTRPAIGADGVVYVNNEAYFRCANADCTVKWSFYGSIYSYWSGPAIDNNGVVYSARRDNGLCAWHD